MRDLDTIGEELFNKIRGRYPSVTLGNEQGQVTNNPREARFFDFKYEDSEGPSGNVSVSLSEDDGVVVLFNSDLVTKENSITRSEWYGFLKEIRRFARKRTLKFDTRDINRSNLQKRDYSYLAKDPGDGQMTESKMYGTSRVSYQDIGSARLRLQHTQNVNNEMPASRTQHVEGIYIESTAGERFKYPYKHIAGARAMARHVAEGGVPHDDFGQHIVGLSEELANLKKFNSYMRRSSVMAEGLGQYTDVVKERVESVKSRINKLQRENFYREEFEGFEKSDLQEVPEDVQSDWVAQLTIKQFNEELKDVFPYIYKLIGEAKPKELTANDLAESEPERAETFGMDDIHKVGKMDIAAAKEYAHQIIDGTTTKDKKKMFLHGQVEKAHRPDQLQAILTNMLLAGEGLGVVDHGYQKKFEQELDRIVDGEEPEKEEKTPVPEYIMSMFDRDNGTFPKGETAVLTAIEKDYGEQYITPAKHFIERIQEVFAQHSCEDDMEPLVDDECECDKDTHVQGDVEFADLRRLSGLG